MIAPCMIPIESARELADLHGYAEIKFCETSRLISFRNEADNTRVNVYYTTGTVATCIHHPTKGKTQLFRRKMTTTDLDTILQDPRKHTGAGYYCTKKAGSKRDMAGNSKMEGDDAQRWRYVQVVTGFCSPLQASQIAAFCGLWDALRFAPGTTTRQAMTSLEPEFLAQCRCGRCHQERSGSTCSLGEVLWNVLENTTEPGKTIVPALISFNGSGQEPIATQEFKECQCDDGKDYKSLYGMELTRLERQLMSFPKELRRELVSYYFKKLFHSYELLVHLGDTLPALGNII